MASPFSFAQDIQSLLLCNDAGHSMLDGNSPTASCTAPGESKDPESAERITSFMDTGASGRRGPADQACSMLEDTPVDPAADNERQGNAVLRQHSEMTNTKACERQPDKQTACTPLPGLQTAVSPPDDSGTAACAAEGLQAGQEPASPAPEQIPKRRRGRRGKPCDDSAVSTLGTADPAAKARAPGRKAGRGRQLTTGGTIPAGGSSREGQREPACELGEDKATHCAQQQEQLPKQRTRSQVTIDRNVLFHPKSGKGSRRGKSAAQAVEVKAKEQDQQESPVKRQAGRRPGLRGAAARKSGKGLKPEATPEAAVAREDADEQSQPNGAHPAERQPAELTEEESAAEGSLNLALRGDESGRDADSSAKPRAGSDLPLWVAASQNLARSASPDSADSSSQAPEDDAAAIDGSLTLEAGMDPACQIESAPDSDSHVPATRARRLKSKAGKSSNVFFHLRERLAELATSMSYSVLLPRTTRKDETTLKWDGNCLTTFSYLWMKLRLACRSPLEPISHAIQYDLAEIVPEKDMPHQDTTIEGYLTDLILK